MPLRTLHCHRRWNLRCTLVLQKNRKRYRFSNSAEILDVFRSRHRNKRCRTNHQRICAELFSSLRQENCDIGTFPTCIHHDFHAPVINLYDRTEYFITFSFVKFVNLCCNSNPETIHSFCNHPFNLSLKIFQYQVTFFIDRRRKDWIYTLHRTVRHV